jgi:hypothetical protein
VLLKYRVPNTGPHLDGQCNFQMNPKAPMALEDAQRTVGLVRFHAAEYQIDPHKICRNSIGKFFEPGAVSTTMTAMPSPSSGDHVRSYLAYFCLFLLFAISVTYHTRTATQALGILLHSNEHVRGPFEIDGPEMALTLVKPEARAQESETAIS